MLWQSPESSITDRGIHLFGQHFTAVLCFLQGVLQSVVLILSVMVIMSLVACGDRFGGQGGKAFGDGKSDSSNAEQAIISSQKGGIWQADSRDQSAALSQVDLSALKFMMVRSSNDDFMEVHICGSNTVQKVPLDQGNYSVKAKALGLNVTGVQDDISLQFTFDEDTPRLRITVSGFPLETGLVPAELGASFSLKKGDAVLDVKNKAVCGRVAPRQSFGGTAVQYAMLVENSIHRFESLLPGQFSAYGSLQSVKANFAGPWYQDTYQALRVPLQQTKVAVASCDESTLILKYNGLLPSTDGTQLDNISLVLQDKKNASLACPDISTDILDTPLDGGLAAELPSAMSPPPVAVVNPNPPIGPAEPSPVLGPNPAPENPVPVVLPQGVMPIQSVCMNAPENKESMIGNWSLEPALLALLEVVPDLPENLKRLASSRFILSEKDDVVPMVLCNKLLPSIRFIRNVDFLQLASIEGLAPELEKLLSTFEIISSNRLEVKLPPEISIPIPIGFNKLTENPPQVCWAESSRPLLPASETACGRFKNNIFDMDFVLEAELVSLSYTFPEDPVLGKEYFLSKSSPVTLSSKRFLTDFEAEILTVDKGRILLTVYSDDKIEGGFELQLSDNELVSSLFTLDLEK